MTLNVDEFPFFGIVDDSASLLIGPVQLIERSIYWAQKVFASGVIPLQHTVGEVGHFQSCIYADVRRESLHLQPVGDRVHLELILASAERSAISTTRAFGLVFRLRRVHQLVTRVAQKHVRTRAVVIGIDNVFVVRSGRATRLHTRTVHPTTLPSPRRPKESHTRGQLVASEGALAETSDRPKVGLVRIDFAFRASIDPIGFIIELRVENRTEDDE